MSADGACHGCIYYSHTRTVPPAEQLYTENLELKGKVAVLEAQLAWFKKRFYGSGQSEKLDPGQLKLVGLEETRAAVAERTEKIAYERTARREPRPTPAEAFAHVPVTETVEIVPLAVQQDPALYEKIGEERTFEIDVIAPKLVKREIVRPKFGTGWIGAAHRCSRRRRPAWCRVVMLRPD